MEWFGLGKKKPAKKSHQDRSLRVVEGEAVEPKVEQPKWTPPPAPKKKPMFQGREYEIISSFLLGRSPTGIAVNPLNDHILLCYWGNHWIEEYSPYGTLVRNIPGGDNASGMAIDEATDNIVITEFKQMGMVMRSAASNYQSATRIGNLSELNDPSAVAIDTTKQSNIVVANTGNHNILIYSQKGGALVDTIGSQGEGEGQFIFPSGVAIDPRSGNIIVSDTGNHRIQIFEPSGKFVRAFGRHGTGDGEFKSPKGVVVATGLSGWSPSTNSDYPTQFKEIVRTVLMLALVDPNTDLPRHPEVGFYQLPMELLCHVILEVSKEYQAAGEIIVADSENHRIQVFSTSGVWRATINGPAGDTRAVAVSANRIIVPDGTHVKIFG